MNDNSKPGDLKCDHLDFQATMKPWSNGHNDSVMVTTEAQSAKDQALCMPSSTAFTLCAMARWRVPEDYKRDV